MNPLLATATAGAAAGLAKTLISHPFDTLKVYSQVSRYHLPSMMDLYKGIEFPLIRNAIDNSSHMFFRDLVKCTVNIDDNIFSIGFLAGILQALVTNPLDYLKLQRQLSQPFVIQHIYRGLHWTVLKESISGAIFLTSYEELKKHSVPPGHAGSASALTAMILTFPLDTLRVRVQSGAHMVHASHFQGIGFALAKCILSNFVALTVYEGTKIGLNGASQTTLRSPSV